MRSINKTDQAGREGFGLRYGWILIFATVFCSGFLTGCSDLKFAGTETVAPEKDPRSDIVLTDMTADMTSGGLVQQKISGKNSVYSQQQNELTIKGIEVTALDEQGSTRSVTDADLGQIFFSDRPESSIGRKDMRFAGNVIYLDVLIHLEFFYFLAHLIRPRFETV